MNAPPKEPGASRARLLADGAATLRAAGVPDPAREARLILRWAADLSAAALSARLDAPPGAPEAGRFAAAVAARAARRPLAQVIGVREFWGRAFAVTSDVLDPRPESETLIAAALEGGPAARVLDLGLGSGCLLLTLLAEWPEATGLGVERSAPALAVARRNARALGLDARCEPTLGDWWDGVRGRFDLVVSNPPYVTEADYAALSPEVRGWEPVSALIPAGDAGDGLADYRRVAAGLPTGLAPGGRVLLEVGPAQARPVAALLEAAGLTVSALHSDLDGRERVVEARLRA